MKNTPTFSNLVEAFKMLPGVGEKSAERMAYSIIDMNEDRLSFFIASIKKAKNLIHQCPNCGGLIDSDICPFCSDKVNHKTCIVVAKAKDIDYFSSLKNYHGTFHVLNGEISSLKGIKPESLRLKELEERIENEGIEELILATNPTVEGETTALYIAKYLEGKVKTSRIAYGVPIGGNLEYVDDLTINQAIENRKEIK